MSDELPIDREPRYSPVPPLQNKPYPGKLQILVDASDVRQGIFRTRQIIPVDQGPLILLYPQWIPGHHSPTGPIANLAGLTIQAHGKELTWRRSQYDVYAFWIEIPTGTRTVEVNFEYLSPRAPEQGPIEMTPDLLNLIWEKTTLYPAGYYSRQIVVEPAVKLPAGWQYATPLREISRVNEVIRFAEVPYNVLVDSPLYAGRHAAKIDLDPGAQAPVILNLFGDTPKCIKITPAQTRVHQNLVQQSIRLFGSRHYDRYEFLVSVSDYLSTKGLEHHQCSEDGHVAGYLSDWENSAPRRDLLAHEYVHSWNGKFRRPADNWTPNFNVPMGDSLLWVYEGQTQYWGFVLTARAEMWSPQQYRDALAQIAGLYDRGREGFAWRGISDTANDPTIALRRPKPYLNWQMREEYYNAGQLLWLWVDVKIRQLTKGAKSLDDFARGFFGIVDGRRETITYEYEDVVAALNGVVAHAWDEFLTRHVQAHCPPLAGIEESGWRLVYTEEPSEFEKQMTKGSHRHTGFMSSLGLGIDDKGAICDVRWKGPAWQAGVSSGEKLVAVNNRAYKPQILSEAIAAAARDGGEIELLVLLHDRYRTIPVTYHGGLQYPHLERIPDKPDYLSAIIAPRRGSVA